MLARRGPRASPLGMVAFAGQKISGKNIAARFVRQLFNHIFSAQKQINIPLTSAVDVATGALCAVFANGASTTPGTQLTNAKVVGIRWNNDAAPGAIGITIPMPQDLDDTSDISVHALVSKTGATVGDATSLTIGAFFQEVAALHDADADCGGASDAVVGNATAKTVTELTRTIVAADVPAAPCSLTLTVKPTATLLGTDDFLLHALWIEYKPKLMTA